MKRLLSGLVCLCLALALCACGAQDSAPPAAGTTVYPTADTLEQYVAIMHDGFGNNDSENPLLVACGYSCEYQPGLGAQSADLSFDMVYAFGVKVHVHFTGEPIVSGDIPLSAPIPFHDADYACTFENVEGSITF